MNHDEAAKLIGPYRDGELDLASCVKLEEHLAECPSCREKLEAEDEMVSLIQAETPRFKPSPFLKTRILANLREKESPAPTKSRWNPVALAWTYSGLAVGVMAVLSVGIFLAQGIPALDREAISDHVRSLQVNHLIDVVSTDEHTVKPWFAGKLDFSPQVINLATSGYPLIGGRLDVLDHRNVAAIIYQRRKHYINLFVWPAESGSVSSTLHSQDGYHALGWTRAGMNYLAVSELGEKELRDFAQMIQDQTLDSKPE